MTKWQSNVVIMLLGLILIALVWLGFQVKSGESSDVVGKGEQHAVEGEIGEALGRIERSINNDLSDERFSKLGEQISQSVVKGLSEVLRGRPLSKEREEAPVALSVSDPQSIDFLPIEGITAQVRQQGNRVRSVRFNLNIVFDGKPAERLRALELIRQGSRLSSTRQLAEEVIRSFDYEQIIEPEFPNTFEREFKDRFNSRFTDMKVDTARPFKWDFN